MKMTSSLFAVVLLTGCFGGPCECPVSDYWGVLQGAPMSLTTNNQHSICYKFAGFLPPDCAQGQNPDFARIPSDWLADNPPPSTSPVLAMSLGIDVISVEHRDLAPGNILDGVPLPSGPNIPVAVADLTGSHGWMAILFSAHEPVGVGPDPLANAIEAASCCGELDRTVFQYVLPGSVLGDEGVVLRVLSPDDLALSEADKIQALNMHLTWFHAGVETPPPPNQYFSRPLPTPVGTKIYFTLHRAVINAPPFDSWFSSSQETSSATILMSEWNGQKWTPPKVFRTYQQLNLQRSDVIDGLAIDTESGVQILFSTHAADVHEQMQYFSGGQTRLFAVEVPPGSGEHATGGKVLKSRKALGDFCVGDPWVRTPVNGQVLDDYIVARPLDPAMVGEKKLVASGFRQVIDKQLLMRTCMSMNNPPAQPLVARVKFGMTTYTPTPNGGATVGTIVWFSEPPQLIPFDGRPVSADHDIPTLGPQFTGKRAIVAQWSIKLGNQVFVAPLCVLRL